MVNGLLPHLQGADVQPLEAVARVTGTSPRPALDLHDLCDINPAHVHVTVPASYRLRRDMPAMYRHHRRDLVPGDITRHEGIPIVSVKRAILDGIESGVGGYLIDQAVETARRRGLVARAEMVVIIATRHEPDRAARQGAR